MILLKLTKKIKSTENIPVLCLCNQEQIEEKDHKNNTNSCVSNYNCNNNIKEHVHIQIRSIGINNNYNLNNSNNFVKMFIIQMMLMIILWHIIIHLIIATDVIDVLSHMQNLRKDKAVNHKSKKHLAHRIKNYLQRYCLLIALTLSIGFHLMDY